MTTSMHPRPWARAIALAALALALPRAARADHPAGPVTLRDLAGNGIPPGSSAPYSPEKTCGACHAPMWSLITNGYHFQQGRTDGGGWLRVADDFLGASLGYDLVTGLPQKGSGAWWKLSDGMYGKW